MIPIPSSAAYAGLTPPTHSLAAGPRTVWSGRDFYIACAVTLPDAPPRSRSLPRSVAHSLVALADHARAGLAREWRAWRRARSARADAQALSQLDSRTLRDLGLDRSEIASVACEMHELAQAERLVAIQALGRRFC